MNRDNRLPTAAEQQKMDALVETAMKDGASGYQHGVDLYSRHLCQYR